MNIDERTQRMHQFPERVGLFWEGSGGSRMAGRVLGWLLICDPPEQSLSQIATEVMASKASISAATRSLMVIGLIERVPVRGDRAAWFRMVEGGWGRVMEAKQSALTLFRELAEEGLAIVDGESPERRARLDELRDLYAFMEEEMPKIMADWRERRGLASED